MTANKNLLYFFDTRVLIADDCDFNLDILTEMLHLLKVDSDCAVDGLQAVQMATQNHYDLVLMDIQMPNKDGITATKEIKKQVNLPIIAITASAVEEEKQKCLKAGMDDYISKPITLHALQELLSKHLKQKISYENKA